MPSPSEKIAEVDGVQLWADADSYLVVLCRDGVRRPYYRLPSKEAAAGVCSLLVDRPPLLQAAWEDAASPEYQAAAKVTNLPLGPKGAA